MNKLLTLMLSIYLIINQCAADDKLLVEIEQGKLSGKIGLDRNNGTFYSFLSIPYAKAPIRKLRFKAPEVPEPWIGIRNATEDLPMCPQRSILTNVDICLGDEDCLFLNVHTPKPHIEENETLQPVMVYIHGGAYIEGSGTVDPRFLMGNGIVLVSINYRLGLLGFLSSTDDTLGVHGNNGFKDQNAALKWVQKNIQKFGGDPDNVTIFGQSAGGSSVHLHVLSPMSKGLFHKAISMSGTALAAWNNGIKGTFEKHAKTLNISTDNKVEMLEMMQNIPLQTILKSENKSEWIIPIYEEAYIGPVVETLTNNEAFLPAKPIDIIKSGKYNKVPFFLGYTDLEGILFELVSRLVTGKPMICNDFKLFIPNDLKLTPQESQLLQDKIKNYYFEGKDMSDSNLRNFTDLASDLYFSTSVHRTIKEHLKHDDVLYSYRFSADTKLNDFKRLEPHTAIVPGAAHCDDLSYLFNSLLISKIEKDSVEDKAITKMISLYTNFAKYGTPTPVESEIQWLPVTKDKLYYLDIETKSLTLRVNPDKERADFWEDIYNKYGDIKTNEL